MVSMPSIRVMKRAFAEKDATFDGTFFVAVKTTGIFCRPVCRAKPPREKNLEFYPNSKLEVFNRWGTSVYESDNYRNDWKGGDLSDGVYFYVLKIPERDALKGTVTIKK